LAQVLKVCATLGVSLRLPPEVAIRSLQVDARAVVDVYLQALRGGGVPCAGLAG